MVVLCAAHQVVQERPRQFCEAFGLIGPDPYTPIPLHFRSHSCLQHAEVDSAKCFNLVFARFARLLRVLHTFVPLFCLHMSGIMRLREILFVMSPRHAGTPGASQGGVQKNID